MFAGKSTELIKRIRKLNVLNKKYISVKPIIDKRYSEKQIVSHNNDRINCSCFDSIDDFISDINLNNLDTVFIEEGQFFPRFKKWCFKIS